MTDPERLMSDWERNGTCPKCHRTLVGDGTLCGNCGWRKDQEKLRETNTAIQLGAAELGRGATWRWKIRYRDMMPGMRICQLYCAWSARIDLGLGWELVATFIVPDDVLQSFIAMCTSDDFAMDSKPVLTDDGWTEEKL